jgi:hypothetical protein
MLLPGRPLRDCLTEQSLAAPNSTQEAGGLLQSLGYPELNMLTVNNYSCLVISKGMPRHHEHPLALVLGVGAHIQTYQSIRLPGLSTAIIN